MVNIAIIIAYLAGTLGLGLYLSRYIRRDEDFFLAGRSLNRWVIAGTVTATDISAIYLIGPAGNAYEGGVPVLLCGWTGNMIAAMSALIFVPRLRRLRITTVSEVLEARYGLWMRLLPTTLWIFYYALFAGNSMYVFSVILGPVLGIAPSTIILVVGAAVILCCFSSGLLAVVYTEVIQAFLIIIGALILLPLTLRAVGGVESMASRLPADYFYFWKGAGSPFPNYKDLIMFALLGLPYWCTSQYMLQHSFAGKSVREASRGLALAALMTAPITMAYIVPGMCGSLLYSPEQLGSKDSVLVRLFADVLPVGLGGLFIAALLAANNSASSSLLNSLSTLAVNDIYRRFVPSKSSRHYTWVGRAVTVAGGAIGLVFAFNVERLGGIIEANFEIMSFFEPPIFVIVAAALFWRSANAWGAGLAIVSGVAFNSLAFLAGVSSADRTFVAFPLCVGGLVFGSWLGSQIYLPAGHDERAVAFLTRVERAGERRVTLVGVLGLAIAGGALAAFVAAIALEGRLAGPLNVLVVLGCVLSFVLGCYLAIPVFVGEEEGGTAGDSVVSLMDGGWLHRIAGKGVTWVLVYLLSMGLVFLLYFG